MLTLLWVVVLLLSVGAIVCGAETFAKHLAAAASQLGSVALPWPYCLPAQSRRSLRRR
jgi:hypothetical protein